MHKLALTACWIGLIILMGPFSAGCTANSQHSNSTSTPAVEEVDLAPEEARSPTLPTSVGSPEEPPQKIGPGPLFKPDGTSISLAGEVLYIEVDTNEGGCTLGVWPNLQPAMSSKLINEERNAFLGGQASLLGDDFIKLGLKVPLKGDQALQSIEHMPQVGLCYVDSKGTVLVSLTGTGKPPGGFQLFGQAATTMKFVNSLKADKKPQSIVFSGNLRI